MKNPDDETMNESHPDAEKDELSLSTKQRLHKIAAKAKQMLSKILLRIQPGADYDDEYIWELEYKRITTYPPSDKYTARCDVCGRLFHNIELCIEHVAHHDSQVGDNIDPFDEEVTFPRVQVSLPDDSESDVLNPMKSGARRDDDSAN